jgi:hypothetical protein
MLLSMRLRRWLFAVLVLPLIGRVLTRIGSRVESTRPQAGRTLTGIGQTLGAGQRQRRSPR